MSLVRVNANLIVKSTCIASFVFVNFHVFWKVDVFWFVVGVRSFRQSPRGTISPNLRFEPGIGENFLIHPCVSFSRVWWNTVPPFRVIQYYYSCLFIYVVLQIQLRCQTVHHADFFVVDK